MATWVSWRDLHWGQAPGRNDFREVLSNVLSGGERS